MSGARPANPDPPETEARTATLSLRVQKYLLGQTLPAGAVAEVYSGAETTMLTVPVGTASADEDGDAKLEIPPGPFVVRVRLPSGERLEHRGEATAGDTVPVVLHAEEAHNEFMTWPTYASKRLRDRDRPARRANYDIWARAILRDGPTIGMFYGHTNARALVLSTRLLAKRGGYVHVGGPGIRPLCVCAPGNWVSTQGGWVHTDVVVRPARSGLHVSVVVQDPQLAPLLAYLEAGDFQRVEFIFDKLAFGAEAFAYDKRHNPFASALGGYTRLRLRLREPDRMHEWHENLANWFTWLPDGAVIHGWKSLLEGDLDRAAAAFVVAAARGVPYFRDGVRLLSDGLRILCPETAENVESGSLARVEVAEAQKRIRGHRRGALSWARGRVQPYADALEPGAGVFTTFRGHDPAGPDWAAIDSGPPSGAVRYELR